MPAIGKLIVLLVILVFAFFMQNWRSRYFDFQCPNCGGRFQLSNLAAVFSPHMMGNKFTRCPHCGKWGLAVPVPKNTPKE